MNIKRILAAAVMSAAMIMTASCSIEDIGAETEGTHTSGKEMTVHFIDVGQADSICVQLPNGKTMLIDAGNNDDSDFVCGYLEDIGVSRVDYLIGTHPHEDHIGGLDAVIDNFDIGDIYMPKKQHTTATFRDVLTAVKNKGLKVKTAQEGVTVFDEDGVSAVMTAPCGSGYESLNNWSAVIKLTYNDVSFLFTGDAEELSESEMTADVSADVLKVGHHGSSTSTSKDFLRRVSPKYAVISAGKDNSYGHPHKETLKKLAAAGVTVYRTDQDGTVIMTTDGENIDIKTER